MRVPACLRRWWPFRSRPRRPALVYHWHGYRAGLDASGRGGPPVGLDDLRAAHITHVGVPQHHTGDFGTRNYILDLQVAGFRIVRTIEQFANAGLGRDLGELLRQYHSPGEPGDFFRAFADTLMDPCEGIAWNLEHDILTASKYPITEADQRLAAAWGLAPLRFGTVAYVHFRAAQFARLFRGYFDVARRKHPACTVAIAYSGYGGLPYSRGRDLAQTYGVDWDMLGAEFRGAGTLYAHCAYWWEALPAQAQRPAAVRLLHHIGGPQMMPEHREAFIRAQVRDRLGKLRPGDGLGLVHAWPSAPTWTAEDAALCRWLGAALER